MAPLRCCIRCIFRGESRYRVVERDNLLHKQKGLQPAREMRAVDRPYLPKPAVHGDDGREIELLRYIYNLPNFEELRGSPPNVIAAIDQYARQKNYLMNVGSAKGSIVTDLIAAAKPKVMVELGGYVGYSTVLFGDAARRAGGEVYYSLERNPVFVAVSRMLLDLAGLGDFVKVVTGTSDVSLFNLKSSGMISHIDMLFLDHYKPAYVADLKLCEQLGMILPGSVLAADNVISPGNPPYLKYVRSSVEEKRATAANSAPSRGYDVDGFSTTVVNRYGNTRDKALAAVDIFGNPNLIYESRLVNSFEPTGEPDGVEITRCVGIDKRPDSKL
ncbi:catechol O-methyltransferase [Histoplasma capsulatum var. duboisii H88]|uniref:catechol O-methyltransferase n=2 Tax=Ajellomyces capsulatus TaxID=5037 RepID=A0A8A1LNR4_AJEC8|nr:catechol O-methyltransferase [Histoplasma capsulatum var. duboisii H88]